MIYNADHSFPILELWSVFLRVGNKFVLYQVNLKTMEGIMFTLILIQGLVTTIITWLFILIRKYDIKKNAKKFDINILTFAIIVASGIYYNFINYSNMSEFLVKGIIQFLSLVIYTFVSIKLFQKANLNTAIDK